MSQDTSTKAVEALVLDAEPYAYAWGSSQSKHVGNGVYVSTMDMVRKTINPSVAALIEAARPLATERDALAAQIPGWRLISTAPDDNRDILVAGWVWWDEPGDDPEWVWWTAISSRDDQPHRRGYRHRNGAWWATHWTPLPEPLPKPEGPPSWIAGESNSAQAQPDPIPEDSR